MKKSTIDWGEPEQAQLIANGDRLSALYGTRAPSYPRTGAEWETFSLACLARCHYTLQTILHLHARELDCAALSRVLYEHVVTFAWIAIDPPRNYPMLQRWEYLEREKLRKDMAAVGSMSPDPDAIRRAFVGMAHESAPATIDRALAAQKHWSRCITDWSFRFRRAYASLFRGYSWYVHPTIAGVDAFVDLTQGAPRVGVPRAVHGSVIKAEAVASFADALAVASFRLHWPPMRELLVAFTEGFVKPTEPQR